MLSATQLKNNPKITILYPYIFPGYKAGGITQSIYNLSAILGESHTIQIICLDHDFHDTTIYPFVANNREQLIGNNTTAIYLHDTNFGIEAYKKIKAFNPDIIYVNSVFNAGFLFLGIVCSIFFNKKLVIAPRGMLHDGGLQKGRLKKTIYLKTLQLLLLSKVTQWHATDNQEIADIKTWFGKNAIVNLAADTPRPLPTLINLPLVKPSNTLRLVYYSLITSKKNLFLVLKALAAITSNISLDVYGPIIEVGYWDDCLSIINNLPSNVSVTYKGNVLFSDFANVAASYHFLMLPSKGENFGHVVYEALSLGLPVMISRFTPWQFKEGSMGYYVDLDVENITNTIKTAQQLTADEHALLSKNARQFAESFYNNSAASCQEQYGAIFNKTLPPPKGNKPVLLIIYDYFIPGFKAGGPIQSLSNMVALLHRTYDCRVITQAYDLNSLEPYDGINIYEWNNLHLEKSDSPIPVFYTPKGGLSFFKMRRLLKQVQPDVVYINGIYTFRFALQPLLLCHFTSAKLASKIVVCPRGMLQAGALAVKPLKKKAYLFFLQLSGVLKQIFWHATNVEELVDIKHIIGANINAQIAHNIPKQPINKIFSSNKKVGELRLVYLSLIAQKKNLDLLITILLQCKGTISLDIYGPIKEPSYWHTCEQLMQQTPENITITYKGLVLPENVQQTLVGYQALALVTKGENFGHALVESFGSGRPVITSASTPWHFLEEKKGGWIMPIDNIKQCITKMDAICQMDETQFAEFNNGAYQFATQYFADTNFEQEYAALFALPTNVK